MRTILLKLSCKKATGCCGSSGRKPSFKHAMLRIEEVWLDSSCGDSEEDSVVYQYNPPEGNNWNLLEATPLYGNPLTMAKKHATGNPAWAGTVTGMKLDKDADFMAQLNALDVIPKGCVIAE